MFNQGGPEVTAKSGNTKELVLLMHGVGSSGDDMIQLVPYLQNDMPDAHFIAPNGIERFDQEAYGYQWFSVQNRDLHVLQKLLGGNALSVYSKITDKLLELGLGHKDLILIGFSQGTMLSLYLNTVAKEKFRCIIGFSGAFIPPLQPPMQDVPQTPTCLIHGKDDEVLDVSMMRQSSELYRKINSNLEIHEIDNLQHTIDDRGVKIALNFINHN